MANEPTKIRIQTADAPSAIGPYSQAIVAHGMIYCAGQVALDPATGTLVEGDVQVQTRRALDNLGAVLAAAGSGFGHIVKTTVFLAHFSDFAAMNEVYGLYFAGADPPARSTVEVSALPRNALIEIECIAVQPPFDHPLRRRAAQNSREEEFDVDADADI
jgi:2-iminobutanoate/2-iminopropanoate deaminase